MVSISIIEYISTEDIRLNNIIGPQLTGSSDGQRTGDGTEFLVGDEGRVGIETNVDLAFFHVAADILGTKAVSNSRDTLSAQFFTDVLNSRLDDGVDVVRLVIGEPGGEVGLSRFHVTELDSVSPEKVGDDTSVSIGGELVGEELGVDIDTEDIAQEDDNLLGALVLGVDNIGFDCKMLIRPLRS